MLAKPNASLVMHKCLIAYVHFVLQVLLSLSDPVMADRADYSVLLATTGVPLHRQGLNDLGHTITVSVGTRVSSPVQYKVALTCFRIVSPTAPAYLSELLPLYTLLLYLFAQPRISRGQEEREAEVLFNISGL